jgi:hypothetical protein
MTDGEEVVLTSRRAVLHAPGRGWHAGRLRVSDRELRFTDRDGRTLVVPAAGIGAVRLVRRPRRALRVETPDGPVLLRCFALAAVARLLAREGASE